MKQTGKTSEVFGENSDEIAIEHLELNEFVIILLARCGRTRL